MLINSQKVTYRSWIVGLILLSALTLSSCGRKAEDTAATSTPADSTAQTNPGSTTAAKDSAATTTTKDGTASTSAAAGGATISAEARKLGVKPTDATTCPANAPIKGNVNRKLNKKIYHQPKEAGFDKIKPELCFADAATAQKAGFVARKAATPKTTKTP